MAKSVKLHILTPSNVFYEGNVNIVIARTQRGDEGFMADHLWACKLLAIGELWIKEAGEKDFKIAAVSGGFVDVKDDIVVYTDAAEWSEDIDAARAKEKKAAMETWLSEHPEDNPKLIAAARISVAKQTTRMNVAGGGSRRKH